MLSSVEYEAEWKWMQTPEAAKRSAAAMAKAVSYFKQRYPNADMDAFKVQVTFDKKPQSHRRGALQRRGWRLAKRLWYWPQAMISALGLHHEGGFPF